MKSVQNRKPNNVFEYRKIACPGCGAVLAVAGQHNGEINASKLAGSLKKIKDRIFDGKILRVIAGKDAAKQKKGLYRVVPHA